MLQVVCNFPPPPDPLSTNKREINPRLSLKHLVNAPGQKLPWLPSPLSSSGDGWACCCVLGAWDASIQIDVMGQRRGTINTISKSLSSSHFNCLNGIYNERKGRGGFMLLPLCISLSLYLCISPGTRFILLLLWFHSSGWLSSSGLEGKLKTHPGDTLPLSLTLLHSRPFFIIRNSFLRRVCCPSYWKQKLRVVLFFVSSCINIIKSKFTLMWQKCTHLEICNALLIAHECAFLCVSGRLQEMKGFFVLSGKCCVL